MLDWKAAGLSLAVVFERYGKNGNVGYGFVEGALTKQGAVATTWSHDSHNLFVLGTDENDMKLAQRRVLKLQGAYVVFSEGRSLAEARLTIGTDALSFFDDKAHRWMAEPGDFEALIGNSSDNLKQKVRFVLM